MRASFKKLRVFYVDGIISQIITALLNPIFVIYLLNSGLTHTQLGTIMAVYFSIPAVLVAITGSMADAWSRRKAVMIGILISTISYMLMYFASAYEHFLMAVVLMGIAASFVSTPLRAWMMDEIKQIYGEQGWVGYTSRIMKMGELFFIFASLLAFVFLFRIGGIEGNVAYLLHYFWLVAVALSMLDLLNFIFSKETFHKESAGIANSLKQTIHNYKQFVKLTRSSKPLRYFAASFMAFGVGYSMLFIGFFPYIKDVLGIKEQFFNLIYLTTSLIAIMFYHYNDQLVRMFKGEKNTIIITEILALLLILSLLFVHRPLTSLVLLILIMSIEVGTTPVFNSLLNRPIPTEIRSTTLSFITIPASFGGMIASLLYGIIAEIYGMRAIIVTVSIFVMLGLVLLLKMKDGSEEEMVS